MENQRGLFAVSLIVQQNTPGKEHLFRFLDGSQLVGGMGQGNEVPLPHPTNKLKQALPLLMIWRVIFFVAYSILFRYTLLNGAPRRSGGPNTRREKT